MSDQHPAVAGNRAHAHPATLTNPVAATTSWHAAAHCPAAHCPAAHSSATFPQAVVTHSGARIERVANPVVSRKFDGLARAQAAAQVCVQVSLDREPSLLDAVAGSYGRATPEDHTPLLLSNATNQKMAQSLAEEARHGQ